MNLLLLLLLTTTGSKRENWLYSGGRAKYALHQKKRLMPWGEYCDPGMLARQRWVDHMNAKRGGRK